MKTFKEMQAYFLAKAGAEESYPFGEDTAVYKVGGKMFALMGEREGSLEINLKCDPDDALALRDQYVAIIPGYHMNKKHWNTVILDGTVPVAELKRLIDHSYDLIWSKLPKKSRPAR